MSSDEILDVNHDGTPDGVLVDTNHDGVADLAVTVDPDTGQTVTFTDADRDGQLDTALVDTTGDGIPDTELVDAAGDGSFSTEISLGEPDPNSHDPAHNPVDPDTHDPNAYDAAHDPVEPNPVDPNPANENPAPITEADRLAWEGQFWQQQTENGYCAPTAVAIVLSEFAGKDFDGSIFVQRAKDLGYLSTDANGAWSGLHPDQIESLFESFGVPATTLTPASPDEAWSELTELVNTNHGVIATIDSSEVWNHVDDPATDTPAPDHAVTIAYIDENNVYLNDSGTPDGKIEVVSRADFEQAWADSGHTMIVTDAAAPLPGDTGGDGLTTPASEPGSVLPAGQPGGPVAAQFGPAETLPSNFDAERRFLHDVIGSHAGGIVLLGVSLPASVVGVVAASAARGGAKK
jgi:hypothetical protein